MRRFTLGIVGAGGVVYLASLSIYLLLRWTWPSPIWWREFVDTFALYLLAPALPLLFLGLLLRSQAILVLCVFPFVFFALLYGERFLPNRASVPGSATTVTVMTFNALITNRDYRRVADMIAAEDPDVLAIQELAPGMAEYLSVALADKYPYRALAPRSGFSGVGIFSRFPISEDGIFQVNGRGHLNQRVRLDINGHELYLFNLHLHPAGLSSTGRQSFPPVVIGGSEAEWQQEQIESDLKKVAQVGGPVVVLGDFNLTDQTRQYRQITRHMKDSYREAGWGFGHTFPADGHFYWLPLPLPLLRIDYIFHSPNLVALEAHLSDNAGSDHRPVVARLGLK